MDFHNRQYDPQLGRFMGIDPMADEEGQQTMSPYHAMACNPSTMVDPLGLAPQYTANLSNPNVNMAPAGLAFVEGQAIMFGAGLLEGGASDMMKSIQEAMNAAQEAQQKQKIQKLLSAILQTLNGTYVDGFKVENNSSLSSQTWGSGFLPVSANLMGISTDENNKIELPGVDAIASKPQSSESIFNQIEDILIGHGVTAMETRELMSFGDDFIGKNKLSFFTSTSKSTGQGLLFNHAIIIENGQTVGQSISTATNPSITASLKENNLSINVGVSLLNIKINRGISFGSNGGTSNNEGFIYRWQWSY